MHKPNTARPDVPWKGEWPGGDAIRASRRWISAHAPAGQAATAKAVFAILGEVGVTALSNARKDPAVLNKDVLPAALARATEDAPEVMAAYALGGWVAVRDFLEAQGKQL